MAQQKRNITDFVKRAYKAYFDMKLGDQDKSWAPHMVCKTCVESLRGWTNGKLKLKFAVPMVWREPKNHFDDCYFCLNDMTGFKKPRKQIGSIRAWILLSVLLRTLRIYLCLFSSLPEIDETEEIQLIFQYQVMIAVVTMKNPQMALSFSINLNLMT
ncbi:Uncharacterized protein FKW44_005268 [Caligus rogercresseyi]|uniref:Uncharacterized protein n=1 Tax=Caligus rogercresseyi TaxID=217165 RepID=A0A7T8KBR4_CALRO|nr:Uncharacterized protein FKW44_005268 [Caligus rogercresseyi]